jgi:hypothetical protein
LVDNEKAEVLDSLNMFRQIPLSLTLINLGGLLALIGFFAYAIDDPTFNLIGFFYGIPLLLGGLALKSSELAPVPLTNVASLKIVNLRKEQATPTLNQIREDVTRYRYGQEAHLDLALQKLGLSPTDDERPILMGLKEEEIDNAYALVLEFYSPLIDLEIWKEKQDRLTKFFGPGIKVAIDGDVEENVNITLIVTPDKLVTT